MTQNHLHSKILKINHLDSAIVDAGLKSLADIRLRNRAMIQMYYFLLLIMLYNFLSSDYDRVDSTIMMLTSPPLPSSLILTRIYVLQSLLASIKLVQQASHWHGAGTKI